MSDALYNTARKAALEIVKHAMMGDTVYEIAERAFLVGWRARELAPAEVMKRLEEHPDYDPSRQRRY